MKKKFKFFIISYTIFLFLGIVSCEPCGPFHDSYKVVDLNWKTYNATYIEAPNNELNLSEITENSVLYNKFSIFIEPQKETYFSVINEINSINLISSAYACDPVPPKTNDNIENIEIFANKNFNSNHLIGENLAEIFDVIIYDSENEIYYEKFDLVTYLISKPKVPTEMTLILKESPIETSDFKFTVKYYQNGKDINYLEFETNFIEIKI
jgi:hypothetical protein